jgi:hypothetical protein
MKPVVDEATELAKNRAITGDIYQEINEEKLGCQTPTKYALYSSVSLKTQSPQSITSCLSPSRIKKEPTEIRSKERKVSFHNVVSLILIPTIQEYREAVLLKELWWNEHEFSTFRDETNRSIQQFMISNLSSRTLSCHYDSSSLSGGSAVAVTLAPTAIKKAQAKSIMRLYFEFFLSEIGKDSSEMKKKLIETKEGSAATEETEEDFQPTLLKSVDSVDSEELDNKSLEIDEVSADFADMEKETRCRSIVETEASVVIVHPNVHDDNGFSSFPLLEISFRHSVSLNLTRILTISGLFFLFNQHRR